MLVVVVDYATPQLLGAVRARVAAGPARFHVIVPDGAHGHRNIPDPRVGAERTLTNAVAKVSQVTGIEATGEIGDPSALRAVADVAEREEASEVILSSHPLRAARLARRDLPSRVRRLGLDVVHVEA